MEIIKKLSKKETALVQTHNDKTLKLYGIIYNGLGWEEFRPIGTFRYNEMRKQWCFKQRFLSTIWYREELLEEIIKILKELNKK